MEARDERATGVYGVLQYSVIQRKREMGIRIAVGATSSDMIRLIVGQALEPQPAASSPTARSLVSNRFS